MRAQSSVWISIAEDDLEAQDILISDRNWRLNVTRHLPKTY